MAIRLDFTTLRIFLAVAETRNITRAAEREHIATSAISKRLSDLEKMLGAKLLYRLPRGVELTPAGEALRHHAQNILTSTDRLTADLTDYAVGIKGHVRMMVNPSTSAQFLPEDLHTFCEKYPDINVDLREENSAAVIKAVRDGQCDLGIFSAENADPAGLEVHDYRWDELVLVARNDHPLAGRESIRFKEVLGHYMIGLETMTTWDTTISRAAREAGENVRYRFRLKSFHAACRMVAAGLGVTIVSERIHRAFDPSLGLVAVRLDEPWARRALKIATRGLDGLPHPARLMTAHLRGVD